jgi:sodium transport system ATP-binding protein
MRKGFPLMDALRGRGDASVAMQVVRKQGSMKIGCSPAGGVTAALNWSRCDCNIRDARYVVDCGTGVSGGRENPERGSLMIEARGLSKRFHDKKRGEIRAVDNVSFRCEPGRIYGLLGANGAGKTTTLRILATILEPTDGTALVCGYDVVDQPEKVRANVGFLSTATALYPRLTAQELVEYFGRLNGLDEATLKKRVDDIFNRLDMNGFRDRRCDKLSTGMKQKTSIARTLVHDPPVMIFDEPTLGLDIMTARTITTFIRECRDRGKTVIFSTHIMSEVEKLCDVIGIIHDGRLLTEGTLGQLRERYAEQDLEEIFVKVVSPLQSRAEV